MEVKESSSSVQAQSQIYVQKNALKSEEAVIKKLYEGIENTPQRSSAFDTGHNLNITA